MAVRNLKTINSIVSSNNKENPSEDFYEKIIQEILNMESESELDLNVLLKFDISETIPVLIENEKFDDQIDHLDKSLELKIKSKNYFITNPLLSLSLKSASDSKKLAEVLLISSMILNDYKLSEISSNDVLEIIRALKKTGFERQAMDFTREWLACKLVKKISEPYLKNLN